MKTYSVVIVDDEKLVVSMLEAWVGKQEGFAIAGRAYNGLEGLKLCRRLKPDIIILDIAMPDMDGLSVARRLRRDVPESRIVILSSHFDPYCIYEVSQLGVHGFVNKTCALDVLREALRRVAAGESFYAPVFSEVQKGELAQPLAFHKVLSSRETSVLALLSQGMDDKTIGRKLRITPLTVATHRRNLRKKLKAHKDRELIRYAHEWGLDFHPPGK